MITVTSHAISRYPDLWAGMEHRFTFEMGDK